MSDYRLIRPITYIFKGLFTNPIINFEKNNMSPFPFLKLFQVMIKFKWLKSEAEHF